METVLDIAFRVGRVVRQPELGNLKPATWRMWFSLRQDRPALTGN